MEHWKAILTKAAINIAFQYSNTHLIPGLKIITTFDWLNMKRGFEVSLGYESVDRSTFSMKRGSFMFKM
jgi:hypothetical protein